MSKNAGMQSLFSSSNPLTYFSYLVESDDELPLFEAAASLAHMEDPTVDIEGIRNEVDHLTIQLKQRLQVNSDAVTRLQALNHFFYTELRFGVNQNDFYNPRNSIISHVLKTRRGIPVSLAVVWLELAQNVGLNAMGVGFPGHFLVAVRVPSKGLVVIDPASGVSLGREQLSEHLDGLAPLDENGRALPLNMEVCLRPSTPREVLVRMLRNLLEIQISKGNEQAHLAILQRLIILLPKKVDLRCERGLLLASMQRRSEALDDLEWFLQQDAGAPHLKAQALAKISLLKQQVL